ncbi:MAG: HpcH/HpaI aldolase/citrate lyase family protein, partial [Xanthobacteraceae bacterium]
MRSLLFVPADSARKLDKAMASGADALIVDLEDSIALDGKIRARQSAAAFVKDAIAVKSRPYLLVRVNGLQTGLVDADLDAIAPSKPDAIMLPKAEGAASVAHADAKLAVREALSEVADEHIKILPIATETAASLFLAGTFAGASTRLIGLTWGAEDLSAELGAHANRDEHGRFLDPYRMARVLCLAGAAAAVVPAIDTVYVDFRDEKGFRRECEEALRDGFLGKMAIHPAQVPI